MTEPGEFRSRCTARPAGKGSHTAGASRARLRCSGLASTAGRSSHLGRARLAGSATCDRRGQGASVLVGLVLCILGAAVLQPLLGEARERGVDRLAGLACACPPARGRRLLQGPLRDAQLPSRRRLRCCPAGRDRLGQGARREVQGALELGRNEAGVAAVERARDERAQLLLGLPDARGEQFDAPVFA